MSKFFYHGNASKNNERGMGSTGSQKTVRLGTPKAPAKISVQSEKRKQEVEKILQDNKWVGDVLIESDKDEDIRDLELLQCKVTTATSEKKAGRNDPCPCGSGKKYKKCCG